MLVLKLKKWFNSSPGKNSYSKNQNLVCFMFKCNSIHMKVLIANHFNSQSNFQPGKCQ